MDCDDPPPALDGAPMTDKLFDPATGKALRNEGADRALNADSEALISWRDAAEIALARLAAEGREFSADDVVAEVGPPPEGRHNALGGLFLAARHSGFIHHVGYRQGSRPSAHARIQRTWRGASI